MHHQMAFAYVGHDVKTKEQPVDQYVDTFMYRYTVPNFEHPTFSANGA